MIEESLRKECIIREAKLLKIKGICNNVHPIAMKMSAVKLMLIEDIIANPMSYEEAKETIQRLTGHPNHEIIGIGWIDSDE